MKTIQLIFFLFLIFNVGCSKLGEDLRFNNYTHTDNTGSQIGGNGKDWNLDEDFNGQVNQLLSTSKTNVCNVENDFFIIGYPNPSSGFINIMYSNFDYDYAEFVLVDRRLNVLKSFETEESTTVFSFSLSDINFKRARLFYKFYKGECELRGYGNIFKNN